MTPKSQSKHSRRPLPAAAEEQEGLRVLARIIAAAVIKDAQPRPDELRHGAAEDAAPQGPSPPSSCRRKTVGGGEMKTNQEYDLKAETDHWTGYLLASIAEGDFRDGVSRMIQHYHEKQSHRPAARDEEPVADDRLTLTISEAASILRISRGQAYTLANQGKLPVIRLGRKLIVPRKGLHELLSKG